MINDSTSHLKLPLPHKDNYLEDDVPRLRDAFNGVDLYAQGTDLRLDVAEQDLTTKADAAGTDAALLALGARVDQVAAGVPRLNNTVTSTSTTQAATANAAKLAYDRGTAGVNAASTAQTTANTALTAANGARLPRGIIALWSGAINAVPSGWALCNGTNGTPDLRDRFVVGAGSKYAVGAKAGSETHAHTVSGSVGSTTLSESQMARHLHTIGKGNICGTFGDGFRGTTWGWDAQGGAAGGSSSHPHSLSASASAANGLPPYYALAYIMKL